MLQPQNLASIRKKIYEPLKLKFNQEIAKKVLEKTCSRPMEEFKDLRQLAMQYKSKSQLNQNPITKFLINLIKLYRGEFCSTL
jgi:hypothetical protein